jgi:hypothetical protein
VLSLRAGLYNARIQRVAYLTAEVLTLGVSLDAVVDAET